MRSEDMTNEMSDMDLEQVAAGASAKGAAGQACGALRTGAALCDSLGLGNNEKPSRASKRNKR